MNAFQGQAGYWYGLYQGKTNMNLLSGEPSNIYANPIILQSFYGIGLKTQNAKVIIGKNGAMTIGITNDTKIQSIHNVAAPTYKLYVGGGIRTEEVKVDLQAAWPDYVFDSTYNLMPLDELEKFIQSNKHLPNIPSAKEIAADGLEVSRIITKQQEKIEELTLYIIELNKQINNLEKEHAKLKKELNSN